MTLELHYQKNLTKMANTPFDSYMDAEHLLAEETEINTGKM